MCFLERTHSLPGDDELMVGDHVSQGSDWRGGRFFFVYTAGCESFHTTQTLLYLLRYNYRLQCILLLFYVMEQHQEEMLICE